MFQPQTYPLGDVPVFGQAEAVFTQTDGKPIRSVNVSCGCTTYGITDRDLRVTYRAGSLPEAVTERGDTHYQVLKGITIVYEDETFEQLWVSARVYSD